MILILPAPIHCRGSIVEQVKECYIYPNLMKKQTHLHLGWPEGKPFFDINIAGSKQVILLIISSDKVALTKLLVLDFGLLGSWLLILQGKD